MNIPMFVTILKSIASPLIIGIILAVQYRSTKKPLLLGALGLIGIALVLGIIQGYMKSNTASVVSTKRKIGILQTASHPALDACKNEFINELSARSNNDFDYIIKNGEGSIINLHAAAQELQLNSEIELFYVIATPALETLAPLETERPVIFAAVTDPSLIVKKNETNVTGISDMIDAEHVATSIKTLFPHIKTVGLVYNPSELNSVTLVKEFTKELQKHSIRPHEVNVTSEADVSQAVSHACSQYDLLLAPTDNLVANTAPLIAQISHEYHKPFVVCDLMLVPTGATLALGISYQTCGKEAGDLAYSILKEKKSVQEMPYKKTAMQKGIINRPVFEQLDLSIAEETAQLYNFFPSNGTMKNQ